MFWNNQDDPFVFLMGVKRGSGLARQLEFMKLALHISGAYSNAPKCLTILIWLPRYLLLPESSLVEGQ